MRKSIGYYKNYLVQVKLKNLLQKFPRLYINTQMFRYRGKRYQRKIIQTNTDIVIEGFPRSANSFSVKAFKFANGDSYKIATHLHAFPQVIMGVKHNIPTLLLIRNPFDCIVSYAALSANTYGIEYFNKNQDMKWLLDEYVTFYKNLLPYKNKVVVGLFPEVLKDFGNVLDKVNKKYNTNFLLFEHSKKNVETVFQTAKNHLSPSNEREILKKELLKQMNVLKKTKPFFEAEKLYQQWSTIEN